MNPSNFALMRPSSRRSHASLCGTGAGAGGHNNDPWSSQHSAQEADDDSFHVNSSLEQLVVDGGDEVDAGASAFAAARRKAGVDSIHMGQVPSVSPLGTSTPERTDSATGMSSRCVFL
jgi:hypothetical protein